MKVLPAMDAALAAINVYALAPYVAGLIMVLR